jgi:hypothetical protein
MNEPERGRTRGFFLRWVLLCGLGLGGGLAVGLAVAAPVEALVGMMLVTPVILAVAGSTLGTVQWLAIWRDRRTGALWVAASTIGLGLGMTLGIVLVETLGRALTGEQVQLLTIGPLGRFVGLASVGTVSGVTVGAAQWLALRARTKVSGRWVLSCATGLGFGLPSGGLAADLLVGGLRSPSGFATFLAVAGLVVGALTATGAAKIATRVSLESDV